MEENVFCTFKLNEKQQVETGAHIRYYSKCINTLNQMDGETAGPPEEEGIKNKDGWMDACWMNALHINTTHNCHLFPRFGCWCSFMYF